jgi:hypothetical protein
MMSRIIHGSLSTCEKINQLIEVKQRNEKRYKDYFLDKYGKFANEGIIRNKGREGERQLLWYNRNIYLIKTTAFGRASFYKTKRHSPLYNKQTCTIIHHTTHSTTHSITHSITCSFIPTPPLKFRFHIQSKICTMISHF